jgi:hypothetical protein
VNEHPPPHSIARAAPRAVTIRGATVVLTRAIHAQPPAGASEDDVLAAIRYALTWRGFKKATVSPGRVDFGARRMFMSFGLDANSTSILSGGTVLVADAGRDVRLELRISPLMLLALVAFCVYIAAAPPIGPAERLLGVAVVIGALAWNAMLALTFVGGWVEGAVRDPARHQPRPAR